MLGGAICPSSANGTVSWLGDDAVAGSPDGEAHSTIWRPVLFIFQSVTMYARTKPFKTDMSALKE
jgi:hypothetical protein